MPNTTRQDRFRSHQRKRICSAGVDGRFTQRIRRISSAGAGGDHAITGFRNGLDEPGLARLSPRALRSLVIVFSTSSARPPSPCPNMIFQLLPGGRTFTGVFDEIRQDPHDPGSNRRSFPADAIREASRNRISIINVKRRATRAASASLYLFAGRHRYVQFTQQRRSFTATGAQQHPTTV